jgi:hypothetical protein
MEPLSDRDIGYLTGLFDGEGCVSIMPRPKHNGGFHGFDYAINARIANTNIEMLYWIQSKVGGAIYTHWAKGNRKPSWVWHLGGKAAKSFLELIEPFVIVKRQQIMLGLQFLSMGRKSAPSERAALWQQMKRLNFRGIGETKRHEPCVSHKTPNESIDYVVPTGK